MFDLTPNSITFIVNEKQQKCLQTLCLYKGTKFGILIVYDLLKKFRYEHRQIA